MIFNRYLQLPFQFLLGSIYQLFVALIVLLQPYALLLGARLRPYLVLILNQKRAGRPSKLFICVEVECPLLLGTESLVPVKLQLLRL